MKRKSFFAAVLCLMLAVSLLSAPALADKGKALPQRGKTDSIQTYEAGFEFGQNVARLTAILLALAAVGGILGGVAGRSYRANRAAEATTLHRAYYRPAAKGESYGRMPEAPETEPVWTAEESPVWQAETPSPWPLSPEREKPPVPMDTPAPVHPAVEDNPFAAFEEFIDGHSGEETSWEDEPEEYPEEPGDDEPGDVYFKI